MKKALFFLATAFLFQTLNAQYPSPEPLMQADKEFAKMGYEKGAGPAFDAFADDSVVHMAYGELPRYGKQRIVEYFADDNSKLMWQPLGGFIDPSGNSGFTYGISKYVAPSGDSIIEKYYTYLSNWRKDKTGRWKMISDMGNPLSFPKQATIDREYFKDETAVVISNQQKKKTKQGTVIYFDYTGKNGTKIPAFAMMPLKGKPKAVALFQHGLGETADKEFFLKDAEMLAAKGIASIAIDAPFKRKGDAFIPAGGMRDAEMFATNVSDWLRLIRALPQLGLVDQKIIFTGHSYGVRLAAMMAYLEPRIRHLVFMAGTVNYSEWMRYTLHPGIVSLRRQLPQQAFDAYLQSLSGYDVQGFLRSSKAKGLNIFMQAPLQDEMSEFDFLSTYAPINGNKKIEWYDSGHNLNEKAREDRVATILKWAAE